MTQVTVSSTYQRYCQTPLDDLQHGPTFPLRFCFEISYLDPKERPSIHRDETFCRWTNERNKPPRALEWSVSGKGKSPTALTNEEPERCCADCTPTFLFVERIDDIADIQAPGGVYEGFIVGHGWFSCPQGAKFLIRLVTNASEIGQLQDEALIYEEYEALWTKGLIKQKGSVAPLEFHGFYRSETGSAAAIVLREREKYSQK